MLRQSRSRRKRRLWTHRLRIRLVLMLDERSILKRRSRRALFLFFDGLSVFFFGRGGPSPVIAVLPLSLRRGTPSPLWTLWSPASASPPIRGPAPPTPAVPLPIPGINIPIPIPVTVAVTVVPLRAPARTARAVSVARRPRRTPFIAPDGRGRVFGPLKLG